MTNLPLTSKERKPSQLPGGQIRQDEKYHLLDCLKGNVTNRHGRPTFLDVHGKVLDGPAKVHFMVPGTCGTLRIMSTICDEGTGHCHLNRYCIGCLQVRQLEKCNEREERL